MFTRSGTAYKVLTLATLMALVLGALATPLAFAGGMTTFMVRIENISANTALPSPFAPGAWAIHSDPAPLFTLDAADRGDGLAAIAEDGNPSMLATALAEQAGISSSGVFNTPVGADGPGPLFPGQAYEFTVEGDMTNRYLSFATMFVQSNDIFIGPGEAGIDLFDENGQPISGDVTAQTPFWDVGSEANEAPGMGPNQAPRQSAADTGPAEGVVSVFNNSTRALPLANGMATLMIEEASGTFTVTLENVSGTSGALDTPIAPVFWATHDNSWQLFTTGQPDNGQGLELLAEDGSPANLVASHTGADGIGQVSAAGTGPIGTGGMFEFSVTPDATHPNLTLAAMVVKSNDVFLAFGPEGVALLDGNGMARSVADISADMARALAVWDAGTEANEVPGVGPNQVQQQAAANTGPADPDNTVRLYADHTNDLAGGNLGGFTNLSIVNSGDMTFDVTLTNSSASTAYPGILTPLLWAVHDNSVMLFQTGMPASAGLESLAEDGDGSTLLTALQGMAGVSASGVAGSGPIMSGGAFTATVTVDADHRYLSLANMVVPSNDTFAAFGPSGIALLNEDGMPRSDEELAADIAAEFIAWDAGTERNQAGAAGADQAPHQSGPNTGADEGNGFVRLLGNNDSVWSYPNVSDVVRVTIIASMAPTAVSVDDFGSSERSPVLPMAFGFAALGFIIGGIIVRRRQKAHQNA